MKELLQQYFKQKKIDCYIKENVNKCFTTYNIFLQNVNDFKKFNETMKKELVYTLKTNVSMSVGDKIEIVINNNIRNIHIVWSRVIFLY